MTGARHSTDQQQGESDIPHSFGPSPMELATRSKATIVSRQDEADGSGNHMYHEPKPGEELDFN